MEVIAPVTCPYTLLIFKTRVSSEKIHKNESSSFSLKCFKLTSIAIINKIPSYA